MNLARPLNFRREIKKRKKKDTRYNTIVVNLTNIMGTFMSTPIEATISTIVK